MVIYLVTQESYYSSSDFIGFFDTKAKALSAVKRELAELAGWEEIGKDEWENDDYEFRLSIREVEVK